MPTLYLYVSETVASVRSKIVGYLQAGGSTLSNWIAGGIGQQLVESVANATAGFTSVAAKASRGFASLDTSTDWGDVDQYNAINVTLDPEAPGAENYLSDLGSNVYGTDRIGKGFATSVINFVNTGTGAVNQSLPAFSYTVQRNYTNSDGSQPTYRNSVPINALAGQTVTVAIVAENAGTASNASAGTITIPVLVLPGVTVTNPEAAVGTDRQGADDYREVCREAASLTSPNGPADSYRYLALTGRSDGTYGNSTTGTPLGITRIYVSQDSSTGIVQVFYAGAAGGAAIAGSVATANQILTKTPGVISVPDAITFTGSAATDDTVAITWTIKAKASSVPGAVAGTYTKVGGAASSPDASADAVFSAVDTDLLAYLAGVDIGGFDQVSGAGTLYADEIRSQIAAVWPTTYHTTLAAPASDVPLALGHDAVAGTFNRTLILT